MKKKIIISSFTIIILIFATFLYARYIGTSGLKVKEYTIDANITDNFYGLKIVHFTDLHYKMTTHKQDLDIIVNKINLIKPDIVIFTGDLIDKSVTVTEQIKLELIDCLSKINVKIGKYAVNGNHDKDEFKIIMNNSGFNILNNEYDLIYKETNYPILIAGINSNSIDKRHINEKIKTTYEYIDSHEIQYKILILHEPDYSDFKNFDLILAGHSHNSQINIPIVKNIVKVNGAKKFYKPYYKVNNNDLFISSGIGTSKMKIRLFNHPSFNFYRIV
ncbi:MAG: metallophosphoesterase [Bacilli bacterium]